MDEKQNLYYDNQSDKIYSKQKVIKTIPLKKFKLSRYDSEIFLNNNNNLPNNENSKIKEKASIKNIEFSFPPKKLISHNNISRNITKIRLKHFYKSKSNPLINKNIKLIPRNNMINSFNCFNFKNTKSVFNNILYKPVNKINERNYDREKKQFTNTFYCLKRQKPNPFINNYLNKFSETEKPEKIKKEMIPMIESERSVIKDKLPINTLKHYHRNLFHNKNICNCNEEEKGKNNDRNYNFSQIFESSSQFNNNIEEYEIMELGGKKNYVATRLTKKKKEKQSNRSQSLITLNFKKKQDFHYIMKHPFSNSYFCSSFINQLTDNNNSYTNNFSEKFQNLNNPLNDKDLTDKLHHLILNPNTSKIRNGELLLMYKKFPKGTFYNIYKNSQNNNNDNDIFYNEELKKLENSKYKKYVIKLNKTMERVKNIRKLLDNYFYINKKEC